VQRGEGRWVLGTKKEAGASIVKKGSRGGGKCEAGGGRAMRRDNGGGLIRPKVRTSEIKAKNCLTGACAVRNKKIYRGGRGTTSLQGRNDKYVGETGTSRD